MGKPADTLVYIVESGKETLLSPYLFIIAADILASTITKDHHIKGFKINSKEIKMTQYADDLTLLLSDMNSVTKVLSTLKIFGECSGLKINQDKLTCRPKKRSADKFDSFDPSYCQFLIKL